MAYGGLFRPLLLEFGAHIETMLYKQLNFLIMVIISAMFVSLIKSAVTSVYPRIEDEFLIVSCIFFFVFGVRLTKLIQHDRKFMTGIVSLQVGVGAILFAAGLRSSQ